MNIISTNLGLLEISPRYPGYTEVATRINSFKNWPSGLKHYSHKLAEAGFLYAGYGDYIRCFYCSGGFRNWEHKDDPWTEHARWFPKCSFLRLRKGENFIAEVQIRHPEEVGVLGLSVKFVDKLKIQ
jgi:hypothetical protein